VARLPRPRLPRGGRIRERIRSRRRATPAADASAASEPKPAGRRRGIGERIGSAFRGVRYLLGDALYVAGRGLEAIGRALVAVGAGFRAAWFGLSLSTRRRLAAAILVAGVVAAVWFAAIPNLPCQFPGGDECPPEDDAAKVVPGDALAYAHANVDPETDQYEEAATLAGSLPALSGQLFAFLPGPAGRPLDFSEDVRPWLGGEVAMSIVPGEGGTPEQTFLFEVADTAGAEEFAASVASGPLTDGDHEGVVVRTDQRGNASAIVSGFLVLGPQAAVEATIDAAEGRERALTSSPLSQQILESLPEEAVAEVAVSEDGIADLLAGGRGSLGSLDAFVNFDASVGAGAAVVAEDGAFEFAIHSELDPERLEASPGFFEAFTDFEPHLPSELSPQTLAYLGLGDPAGSIEQLFTQAIAEAPGIATGFDSLIDDLRRTGKLDVQSELLPLLEGEAAFSIQPSPPGETGSPESEAEIPGEDIGPPDAPGETPPEDLLPPEGAPAPPGIAPSSGVPYLQFIADEVDEAAAREALGKLQGPLAEALNPSETLQAPVFQDREIEGTQAFSLRLSRVVDLTYAVFDDLLVVATDPRGVAQVAAGSGGLDEDGTYEEATEGLAEEPALLVYLNLAELLALAEREGLAEDPAYAVIAADARRLEALGLAVETGETTLDTTLRIPVD
jgi:hypothetical protein